MSVVAPKLMQESADGQFIVISAVVPAAILPCTVNRCRVVVASDGADTINNGTDLRVVGCRMGCFQALLQWSSCDILRSY